MTIASPNARVRVTIWNEFVHERNNPIVEKIYPAGIHTALQTGIAQQLGDTVDLRCATLDEPQHGLTDDILAATDVMLWWGHTAHDRVEEEIVAKVHRRVLDGMGLIVLHSGHASKIFQRLMGTSCMLRWREAAETERLWITSPGHPILAGIEGDYIELPQAEMYGEHFDIPSPEELLLVSWFEGGEVFRSGCTFQRGQGKIFYFRPGHETYPIYYNPQILRVISNAVLWARSDSGNYQFEGRHIEQPLSPIAPRPPSQ
ncbi:ThuA domain-containing protein [Aureliella helgolandensis]|uniref:Trehalose utilization n=1 Tax=Aureliella helgolandensis TaxID=2527968 RepID=A0A518G0Y3_9BACT|nr:ThuA domain-containing protein [Aureliella helgolandensis]QDV22174.1 Trehalose utilization [Aureliella helgolandensis]